MESRSSTLQVGYLPSEPPGKPKNTGVGSLSLLQWNLPDPGIEPGSPALQADFLPAELPENPQSVTKFSSVQSLSHVRLFVTP